MGNDVHRWDELLFTFHHFTSSIAGVLVSVDQYMNVQLGNSVEYIDEQNKGPLGEILIRCNNILYISGQDEAEEDEDAMA